jgi:formylglycine-generating enzyme required for sulfatase activity
LEGLAEPGAIFISAGIYEQIRHKLVCGYQPLGERRVKNITEPVSVYRVLPDPAAVAQIAAKQRYRKIAIRTGAGVVVVAAGAMWYAWSGSDALDSSAAPSKKPPQAVQTATLQTQPTQSTQQNPATAPPEQPIVQPPAQPQTLPPQGSLRPATSGASYSLPSEETSRPSQQALQQLPQQTPQARQPPAEQQAIAIPPIQPKRDTSSIAEPEMVFIGGGAFQMGSQDDSTEKPVHRVNVQPFFIGKYPITGKQWRDCVKANGCRDTTPHEDNAPISNVSWNDTQDYVKWLSQATKRDYRLPTEAEWEFAARGGTDTRYWWGNAVKYGFAVCKDCGDSAQPTKVGAHQANPYGLFDIAGGISEWVEDCWFRDYNGAPTNGTARQIADCRDHVLRGGSWRNDASYARSASRDYYDSGVRYPTHGFRVARSK